MPIARLFTESQLSLGITVDLTEEQGHYLRHVMRLKPGDPVILFNGFGGEYRANIKNLTRHNTCCEVEEFYPVDRELSCHIHIIQAANRSEKIETVLQKCTELGAASFQICPSERSDLRLHPSKREARLQRWQRIIVEASEQSGRTMVPSCQWRDNLDAIDTSGLSYALHPKGKTYWTGIRDELISQPSISFAVGPEGGWSENDLIKLSSLGFIPLQFGPRILRTETAAPALTAALQSLLG